MLKFLFVSAATFIQTLCLAGNTQSRRVAARSAYRIHQAQEGKDSRYVMEAGLSSVFNRHTENLNPGSGSSVQTGGNASYALDAKALYLLNSMFEVGGRIIYSETSSKSFSADKTLTATNRNYGVEAITSVNIGNIDRDRFVPFVSGGAGVGLSSSQTDASTSSSSSLLVYEFDGSVGLHFFLDSSVAVTPEVGLSYKRTESKDDAYRSTLDIDVLRIGFSVFL